MRTFGLIGYPLSHSFSQKYLTEKFTRDNISDCEFKNFPIQDIIELRTLIKNNPTFCGLSITIPHKQSVMKYLDKIDTSAKEIGAINCIKVSLREQHPKQSHKKEKGLLRSDRNDIFLTGYNTDAFGFERSLKPLLKSHHNKALILGTGGSAKSVAYILNKSKIKFRYISRIKNNFYPQTDYLSYQDINEKIIKEHTLIINTTPLGMFPNINHCPNIPYAFLSSQHLLYDLTYNPEESLFLKKGKEKGAQIKNGYEMLQLQAEKAWEIWNS